MFCRSTGVEFLKTSRATGKIEELSRTVVKSNVEIKRANKENQIFLNKHDPTAPSFY